MTRNSRRKKRNRSIQRADGVPYSVARRRAESAPAPEEFRRPDFAALYADDENIPPRVAAALWMAAGLLVDVEPDEPVDWLPPVAHREDPPILPRMLTEPAPSALV